jgi:tetraacyldisaccharide 4'-kinase
MPERAGFNDWLMRGWYGGASRAWLKPLALVFAAFAALRRLGYRCGLLRSQSAGAPVIVIGNLVAGGTGKTPLVIWLADQLRARGIQAGVVLRGHGGRARSAQLVTPASDPAEVGDEAVLIARRTGAAVAVGRHRVEAARLLAARGCRVILSDDGLQHLALRRQVEIVVVDGARGFGNGALLPQGPLREAPARLHRVDAVVINGRNATGIAGAAGQLLSMALAADALRSVSSDEPTALDTLQGRAVHAVAGIGNPDRFFALLRELGCRPVEHVFADHHGFTPADLAFADELPIVMTEKDAVKCRAFATARMQYLQVSVVLADADAGRLLQLVEGCLERGERIHA